MPTTPANLDLVNRVTIDGTALNLAIPVGADYSQVFQLKDSAGDGIDITGYTFAGDLCNNRGETLATITVSTLTAADGIFEISIAKAITDDLTEGMHKWNLFRTNTGSATLYMFGKAQVLETC